MLVSLTSISVPNDEDVKHRELNTTAFVKDNRLGKGTLFVAKSRLSWVTDNGQGFELEYPSISLHAVSKDLSNFPSECLFLMIDDQNGSDSESGEDNESQNNEIRFVPEEKDNLEVMFKAMSECQVLHPDPNESLSDEDDDDLDDEEEDIYEDADEHNNRDNTHLVGNVYDVAAAEDSRGLPSNNINDNFANGDSDEPMEVMGQFEDAEPEH